MHDQLPGVSQMTEQGCKEYRVLGERSCVSVDHIILITQFDIFKLS